MPRQVKSPELSRLSPRAKDAAYKRKWREEQKSDPAKKESFRKQQNEYKRRSRAKQKLQQADVEPPAKRCRVATTDAGHSDSYALASNSPTIIAGSSNNTLNTPGSSNIPNSTTIPRPSDFTLDHVRFPVQALPSRQFSDVSVTTDPPPLTSDVEIMTDLHFIDPSPSQESTAAPATTSTPHSDSKDLAIDILGIQVSLYSETVKWSSGFTTVLPCIWKDGKNICQADADTVRYFSQLPEFDPESSTHIVHTHYHDWSYRPEELRDLIAQALREGKCIVIRGADKPQQAKLDVDYLEDRGFSQFMRISIHGQSFLDVEERTRDYTYPQVEGTIEEFIRNLDDPNKIQFILDLPYTGAGIPEYLRQLDHGIVHGWNQTTADYPIDSKVHPDNFLINGWALAHHPAVVTNFHHDSDGGVTFVQPVLGKKIWITAFPKNENISRTTFLKHSMLLTDLLANRDEIEANWHMEVVTLLEGDLFIQPPGQYHAAFTPTASFARGAHCLNFELLHEIELSRYVDAKKGNFLTNQAHEHSLETLERMVLYLPRASSRTRLFTRPLIALCMMVIDSQRYVAAGGNKKTSRTMNTTKPALAISKAIIEHFWNDMETASLVYRFGPDKRPGVQSLTHPGDLVDREELANCLQRFTSF
ncbi:hypothetical protein BDR03DRAFT_987302 [Suillus americanus]|nr:hypothetical protein BDR03DRAFT_987302 [Suillus americanus]